MDQDNSAEKWRALRALEDEVKPYLDIMLTDSKRLMDEAVRRLLIQGSEAMDCLNEHYQHEQAVRSKGGINKAAKLKAIDPHAWMIPYFASAYVDLEAEGKAVIGRRKLSEIAQEHAAKEKVAASRLRQISERRANAYIKQRKNTLK